MEMDAIGPGVLSMPQRLSSEQPASPVQTEPATWQEYLKATLIVSAVSAPSFALVWWMPDGFARNLAGVWFGITLLFLLIAVSFTLMAIVAPGDRVATPDGMTPLDPSTTPRTNGVSAVGRQPGRRRAA